ncbi:saccharopine dehydrogenase C-terminal domain-containing protein [Streptomyces sp. MAR25Y5]|uniref:saccharopine dehydrogenase C-terminal domain-containing protein n=1 Tax=Streptomyces sp. MAR25Y5 TaxID=2962028 RepID=UPI0020B6E15F|nr:saccharopine dehydrogenase C-terminal domain-containing protein [Streptomyces sp. MAR25Y5]MCP3767415.1 saccharopine dehydrogenase NADP-binding domain-containing protein [Streptomyces sp. MAR25Y5]
MPDRPGAGAPTSASGTVHWVGTGMSTGPSGLRLLCDRAERVVLWDRTAERAAERLAALGLAGRSEARALDDRALDGAVRAGDVVVSMLPAAEHPRLLRLSVQRQAHFACTSYVSDAIAEQVPAAGEAGVVVLTEAGLDPGIDHLMAHQLVGRAREAVGDEAESVDFTSYCGGIPAVPNDFRYRFSWAPLGVLTALGSPARHIDDGAERVSPRPWEAVRTHRLGGEDFEVYPNRDSLPFAAQYGIPDGWRLRTFVRGTLRNAGWRAAWSEVFDTVDSGDQQRIRSLAKELAVRYPTTDADRDRVVLSVALDVRAAGGERWQGAYLLDLTGDETESAMARCVSLPLAYGVTRILAGALPAGLSRGAESAAEADRWTDFLHDNGLRSVHSSTVSAPREAGA